MHPLGSVSVAFGLLCFASWPRPDGAYVVNDKLATGRANTMELFAFVLNNDVPWRPVLTQKIKSDSLQGPLYHDEQTEAGARDKLRLVDGQAKLITALPVLKKVLNRYSWLGSHLNFAARVLSTAFSCFTYQNVSLVVKMILLMEYRYELEVTKHPAGIHQHRKDVLMDMLSAFVLLMDKLAAVHSDLHLLANLLFKYDESIYSVKIVQMNDIRALQSKINNRIVKQCEVQGQKTVLENLGITYIEGSPTNPKTTLYYVKVVIDKIIQHLLITYDSLKIESLPLGNWSQITDYQTAVGKKIDPFIIDPGTDLSDFPIEIVSGEKTDGGEQAKPFKIGTSADDIMKNAGGEVSEGSESSTNANTESSAEPNADQS